jgi:prepilin-type N-terminal cleavage/methylation domain-containing protein
MMSRVRPPTRAGFTLIELMVALTIGLMVISAAYYISRTTGRMFSEQLRRAETQLTLRSAVELLRRDISRAGFGSVRGTTEMPGCTNTAAAGGWIGTVGPSSTNVSPVPLFAAWVVAGATPAASHTLYLSGNLTTSELYSANSVLSTPTNLVLQTQPAPFGRSFINGSDGITFMPNRFLDAFLATRNAAPPGRLVHVQDLLSRRSFLRHVLGVTHNNGVDPSIQITPSLPSAQPGEGGCSWGAGQAVISPVTVIRYEVVNTATDDDAAAAVAAVGAVQSSDGWMTGGPRSVLVRREVDAATLGTPTPSFIPGTTRAVVDFIDATAGFRVEAIVDSAPTNTQATPIPLRPADATQITDPATIRSLVVSIIANSAEQQLGSALEQQRVLAGRRATRFEVFMPNSARNPGLRQ